MTPKQVRKLEQALEVIQRIYTDGSKVASRRVEQALKLVNEALKGEVPVDTIL